MLRVVLLLLLVLPGVILSAAEDWGRNHYRLPAYTVYDGDTLTGATVELDFGVALLRQSVRLANFDAPEISRVRQTVRVTDAEIARGKQARDDLAALLKTGDVWISPSGDGKSVYGRLEADVWLVKDGKQTNVVEWMKEKGHVR